MHFSVIIPLFNKAPYVAKAIQSVLSQTFTDYELIIVDDGSKDNSAEIAARAIEGHGNCRLMSQKNAGVSIARNNGVAAASQGDYLCFLDADDWWAPTFLVEMSKLIDEFPDAGIYGTNYIIVNETKRKTRISPIGVEAGFEKGYINYCQTYAKTLAMPLWTGAVCIPRSVYETEGGFNPQLKMGEDFDLWIRIAIRHKVAFLNKPLAFYNQDVDNRAVGRLYKPEEHMLWNLTDLEPLEKTNPDYKQLIDNLRTYSLLPYLLDKRYREVAREELNKVDWNKQHPTNKRFYSCPLWLLRVWQSIMRIGSRIKQKL